MIKAMSGGEGQVDGAGRDGEGYVPVVVRMAAQLHGTAGGMRSVGDISSLFVDAHTITQWDRDRRVKVRRERIALYAWTLLLVVALVGAGLALRRH